MRHPNPGQQLRVLVLDQNAGRSRQIVTTLEQSADGPLTILSASRPEEIIPTARPSFDVAILAVDPHEDALARVEELRRALPQVPVVAIDGQTHQQQSRALIEAGVQDVIPCRCASCPNRLRLVPSLRWAIERARLVQKLEELQRESSHRALHDPLTGLPNRELFRDRLRQAVARAGRRDENFAVMFVDMDGFKEVNDSLGHASGDQLLVSVARRLESTLRASDTCSRWGGDEFSVLLGELESGVDAARVARKILRSIRRPLPVDGGTIRCSVSIGIAIYPLDGTDEQTLMRHADTAMYQVKGAGGGGCRRYRKSMDLRSGEPRKHG